MNMAIHSALPGVEVAICIDGKEAKEYDTENDEVHHEERRIATHQEKVTTTKYIESIADKEFTIKLAAQKNARFNNPRAALSFEVYVGNEFIGGRLLDKEAFTRGKNKWSEVVKGPDVKAGKGYVVKALKFAKIRTTCENYPRVEIEIQKEMMAEVGEISIWVHRCKYGKEQSWDRLTQKEFVGVGDLSEVHEKALKGQPIHHGAALGASSKANKPSIWATIDVDGNDFPRAIFNFKYRSKEALKQLLVIERSPEPEDAIIVAHPTHEGTVLNLESLTAAQQAQIARIILGFNAGASSSVLAVKVEQNVKHEFEKDGEPEQNRKRARFPGAAVVVDLTEGEQENPVVLD